VRELFVKSLQYVNIGLSKPINIEQLIDKCLAIEHDDPCELAYNFLKCYLHDEEFSKAAKPRKDEL
jgi:hypothetical protein